MDELAPAKLFTNVLKTDYFFSFSLLFTKIDNPRNRFFKMKELTLGFELSFVPIMALNPGIYFPTSFLCKILAISVAPSSSAS
jgi:hypothetical protein